MPPRNPARIPRAILDLIRPSEDDQSQLTWTIERMSQKGGWKKIGEYESQPTPPEPTAIDPPRRIRCVRRRQGRIDEDGTEWTVEHPRAQETYGILREIDKTRELVKESQQKDDDDDDDTDSDWPTSATHQLITGLCQGEIDPETADQLSDAIIRASGGDPDDLEDLKA